MATRISNMDVVTSTSRRSAPARGDENSAHDIQSTSIENGISRQPHAAQGSTSKSSIASDLNPTKRQKVGTRDTKAPLGPRPPEFASRRVISDVPVQVVTSPRRSQLPNATSEPFLGLSARKKPSQPVTARPLLPPRTNDLRGSAVASQSSTSGASMSSGKDRLESDKRNKVTIKNGLTAPTKSGAPGVTPSRPKNAALAAARISSQTASGTSTVTPLTIRTRKQNRDTSSGSDGLVTSQPKKFAGSDLVIVKPAASDSVEQLTESHGRTLLQSQDNKRQPSSTKAHVQPTATTAPLESSDLNLRSNRNMAPEVQHQRTAPRLPPRRLSPIPSGPYEEDSQHKRMEQTRPVDVYTNVNTTRHTKELPQNNGNLARTVSPTDARRPKHTPNTTLAGGQGSHSPEPFSCPKPTASSPSLANQKSDASSSPRITPDGHQGFSIGQPLSSRSSYSSLRTPSSSLQQRAVLGSQLSKNPNFKSRNVHSPAGDIPEIVPPVPAIPKGYGSPNGPAEDQFYFNFDDTITPADPPATSMKSTVFAEPSNPHVASSHEYRHKRGLTVASGLGAYENSSRQSSQQMRLPPLNVLPLGKPTTDKIEALAQRKLNAGSGRVTPPLGRKTTRTPSTPMTASRATISGHDAQFGYEAGKPLAAHSNPSRYVPRPGSSAGSSAAVEVTPSPAASPAPFSPVGSLGDSLDIEQNQRRREKERNEMLSGNLKPTESTETEAQTKSFRHFSRDISVKPNSVTSIGSTVPIGSPTHRNFSHAWNSGSSRTIQAQQPSADPNSTNTGVAYDKSLAKVATSARRSVSMNPMPQISMQDIGILEEKPRFPTLTATGREPGKINRVVSHATAPSSRDTPLVHAQTGLASKASTSILAPVHKVLSSRSSLHALKRRQSDVGIDKDEVAADEEMKKLASKRKDFEVAAKELDELRRRATPKERISPSQAAREENLNIFERGEVIDYNDVYFCGSKIAKKFVGDLSSQAANFGFDDERGDYNLVLGDHLAFRYEVIDLLGKGSFGQVARCIDHKTGGLVAVKIIRNKKRFHQQALVEVNILGLLREWDPQSQHSMINFTQSFYFRGHLCISTELLDMNLYELIKAHEFRGFSLKLIRRFTKQILSSLVLLQSHNVIHCDLKPENILLSHPLRSELKVIDFGSSCFHNEKVYTYIQSRFYRSPEVLLGMNYSMPIDMWSLGCIISELLTGYPIFPGENEQEQLCCIMEVFGPPDKSFLDQCSRRKLFFDSTGKPRVMVSTKGKRRRPSSKTLQQAIKCDDEAFLDFVSRCLRWDPEKRMKPDEAMSHEFITGKKRARISGVPTGGASSPTKRYTLQTPSKPRPLPEVPATTVKPGSAVPGPSASPVKAQASLRRHSTISGVPQHGAGTRLSNGMTTSTTSALPRPTPRVASGRSDLASAAALASIVSDVQPRKTKDLS